METMTFRKKKKEIKEVLKVYNFLEWQFEFALLLLNYY